MRKLSDLKEAPAARPRANALVAAATLVSRESLTATFGKRTAGSREWQQIAWEHYDACGELRFACGWLGNSLSRARLFAARIGVDGKPTQVPDSDPAAQALTTFFGGADGQSEMLKRLGPHLTVPGESYLVGWDDPTTGRQEWAVLCNDEIEETVGGNVTIIWQGIRTELPPDALIMRIWRPHPRKYWDADSPVRGLEMILSELYKLTQMVAAQADSRLAGNGMLALPLETTFPPAPGTATESADDNPLEAAEQGLSGFLRTLTEAMVKPIADRDSAAAVVPVVIQAPGEQLKNIVHLSFATALSQEALNLRQEAIKRIAAGLDMPAEIVTGMGDSNHWTAWQIDEGSVKTHIEPVLQLICSAISVCYLRPIVGEDPNESDLMVWFDVSELTQRPDRSSTAKDLFELGELSAEALRREAGFGEDDKPSEDDDKRAVLRGMLDRATIDATTAVELLVLLGYVEEGDLSAAPVPGEVQDTIGVGDEQDPSPNEDPKALPGTQEDPPPEDGSPAALMESAKNLRTAARALLAGHVMDYAGKRLLAKAGRAHRGQHPGTPARELHTVIPVDGATLAFLLDGAYAAFPHIDPQLRDHVDDACRLALLGGYPLNPLTLGRVNG